MKKRVIGGGGFGIKSIGFRIGIYLINYIPIGESLSTATLAFTRRCFVNGVEIEDIYLQLCLYLLRLRIAVKNKDGRLERKWVQMDLLDYFMATQWTDFGKVINASTLHSSGADL